MHHVVGLCRCFALGCPFNSLHSSFFFLFIPFVVVKKILPCFVSYHWCLMVSLMFLVLKLLRTNTVDHSIYAISGYWVNISACRFSLFHLKQQKVNWINHSTCSTLYARFMVLMLTEVDCVILQIHHILCHILFSFCVFVFFYAPMLLKKFPLGGQ